MGQKKTKGKGNCKTYTSAPSNIGWKIISFILAVMLAGTGIACALGWVKAVQYEQQLKARLPAEDDDNNPGNSGDDNSDDKNPGDTEGPDNMLISVGDYLEDTPITMFISALNDEGVEVQSDTSSTFEITAEIKPDNVTNRYLNWTYGWLDPSSEWASGKAVEDYVTVTPTEEGAHNAVAECLKAFSEPIIVTVSTTDGSNLTADCRCDYIKHVIKTNIAIPKASYETGADPVLITTAEPPYVVSLYSEATDRMGAVKHIQPQVVLGEGTIDEDSFTTTVTYTWHNAFYNLMKQKGYPDLKSMVNITSPEGYFYNGKNGCSELLTPMFYSDADYAKAVIEVLNTRQAGIEFTVTTTGQYSSWTGRYIAVVDTSHLEVKASSLTATPNIKFY